MKPNNIMLTGATSFLGKYLLAQLTRRNQQVFATARHERKNGNIQEMDLLDMAQIINAMNKVKPSVVYHLGGFVNLSRDFSVSHKCIDINLKGTLNLLESFRGITPSLMVFVSTEEVYGNGQIPYREDQFLNPPSGYAISKMASEYFCHMYARELGFKLIVLRVATMYGPKDRPTRFIPQIIIKALKNEEIPLNSGVKKRDFVFVDDVAKFLIKILDVEEIDAHTVVNIGGGVSYRLLDLVNIILRETQSSSKLLIGKIPERIGEADEWLMDIQKAKDIFGWQPMVSLEEGLLQTIDYYRKILYK